MFASTVNPMTSHNLNNSENMDDTDERQFEADIRLRIARVSAEDVDTEEDGSNANQSHVSPKTHPNQSALRALRVSTQRIRHY